MTLRSPLLMIFLGLVLLSVLGEIKEKPGDKTVIEECWGNPSVNDCARKCSKSFKCANMSYTCCWTYCGNICWKPKEIYD